MDLLYLHESDSRSLSGKMRPDDSYRILQRSLGRRVRQGVAALVRELVALNHPGGIVARAHVSFPSVATCERYFQSQLSRYSIQDAAAVALVRDATNVARSALGPMGSDGAEIILYWRTVASARTDRLSYWHVDSHLIEEPHCVRSLVAYWGAGTEFIHDSSTSQASRQAIVDAYTRVVELCNEHCAMHRIMRGELRAVAALRRRIEAVIDPRDIELLSPGDIAILRHGAQRGALHRAPQAPGLIAIIVPRPLDS